MRPADFIQLKRSGGKHSEAQLRTFITEYTAGNIPDYQAAAWLMAVYFQGMDSEETSFLTKAMIDSGESIQFNNLLGPLADKHSTGGVGDKLSLILAPMAASCGLQVPMMSGRALGQTGGTLDKLESIQGYRTLLTAPEIEKIIQQCGYCMFGQTEKIVPADKLLYALRDVTATVESIPLITASILSKKYAEGSHTWIFDVKCGQGAFMKTLAQAKALARSLTQTSSFLGRKAVCVITAMDEPLGNTIGNWLEVEESLACLQSAGPQDIRSLCVHLCACMLQVAGLVKDFNQAKLQAQQSISSGKALKKFLLNVEAQGGNPDLLLSEYQKKRAAYKKELKAAKSGWIASWDAYKAGTASCILGAGRRTKTDLVQALAGIELLHKAGDKVECSEVIAVAWSQDPVLLEQGFPLLEQAVRIEDKKPKAQKLFLKN